MSDLGGVLLHGIYGVGAYLVSWMLHRLYTTYRVPRDARRWAIEIEGDIIRLINAHVEVALHDMVLAEKIEKLPKGLEHLEHPILAGGRLGFVVQEAMRARCQQLGMAYPRAWQTTPEARRAAEAEASIVTVEPAGPVSNPPPVSGDIVQVSPPPRLPEHTQEAAREVLAGGVEGPTFIWVEGRVVPRRRAQ